MSERSTTRTLPGLAAIGDFLHWWGGELRATIPPSVMKLFAGEAAHIRVDLTGNRGALTLTSRHGARSLGSCDLLGGSDAQLAEYAATIREQLPERVAVDLYLPGERVLLQELSLPLATEANLDNVFRYEIDRFTPFRADQACNAYRVVGRFPERDQLRVRLAVAPAEYIEQLRVGLARLGLHAAAIYPRSNESTSDRPEASWNMLPEAQRPVAEPLLNGANRRLLGLLAGVLILAFGLPLYWQHATLAELQQNTTTLQHAAAQTGDRLQELRARQAARDALLQHRGATPDKLQIVKDLTGLLPDNTWVTRLEINNNRSVTIQGESAKASDLVAILEKYPLFRNVEFAAAVSRNPVSNLERFELKMSLVAGGTP